MTLSGEKADFRADFIRFSVLSVPTIRYGMRITKMSVLTDMRSFSRGSWIKASEVQAIKSRSFRAATSNATGSRYSDVRIPKEKLKASSFAEDTLSFFVCSYAG